MKKPTPNFPAARYVNIQQHWRRLKPLYQSPKAHSIWKPCLLEHAIFRAEDNGYVLSTDSLNSYAAYKAPEEFDSCDWRFNEGRKGPRPAFWAFACHRACHWLVDLGMFVAKSAWPKQQWRILSSKKHSTIWNGDYREPLLFDGNFLAMNVPASEALCLAWPGRKLKVHQYLKSYLHQDYEKAHTADSLPHREPKMDQKAMRQMRA